ncbi:DUF5655 domain-containing protein [Bacteroidota bacterium]
MYTLESHFSGRPEVLKNIVDKIITHAESFGEVHISSVKNAVLISSVSTFLALKVKKDRVEIEFVLSETREGFPVYKVVRVSKNRVAHFVAVGSLEEVDDYLLGLIRKAYQVVSY